MILPARRRAASVAIHRFGRDCVISKPTAVDADGDGSPTNGYGKTESESWSDVATERVVRIYQDGSDPAQSRVQGGTYRTDSPVLMFRHDSAVQEGFRVMYRSATYEIDSLTFYDTHTEAATTVVN